MKTLFRLIWKFIKWTTITGFILGFVASIGVGYYLYELNKELPQNLDELHDPDYTLPTTLYDRHGNQVDEIFIHRRIVVPYQSVPPHLIQALLASEDTRFFYHFGIDPIRMLKAFWVNLKAKRFVEGASTLTQQTARLFLLTREKKLVRKLKEILLALRIERQFTKEEILTLYLNKVFLGNAEGIEASTQGYFGKHTEELSLAESALLVGLLPAPSVYSPLVNPEGAKERRNLVLRRMAAEGFISEEERLASSKAPVRLTKIYDSTSEATAYYVENVRRYLLEKYGADTLYKGGLQVHLAMDLEYQIYSHEALQAGILELSKRQGFRGPLQHLESEGTPSLREISRITQKNQMILGQIIQGVVTQVGKPSTIVHLGNAQGRLEWNHLQTWKLAHKEKDKEAIFVKSPNRLLKIGDVIAVKLIDWDHEAQQFRLHLHQDPKVNGALLAVDPRNGEVYAMSGGYRYDDSEFNRATQAKRQPGSAFKPIVYSLALDAGYKLSSMLVDSPRHYKTGVKLNDLEEETWTPKNYGNKLLGSVSFREALMKSLNLPTIGLAEDLTPKRLISYARKLGIQSDMVANLTLSLGSLSATLQEMTLAYGVFANQGNLVNPIYITRIEDRDGKILESHNSLPKKVIPEETAFLMTNVLQDVVRRGTARRAIGQYFDRPSAGKTGTTNDSVDAWYIGYIPQLLTGVYVGFDQPKTMGKRETGSRAAAPIWLQFMKAATANLPTENFVQPPDIITVKIHQSGRRATPCDPNKETYYEHFRRGSEPPADPSLSLTCGPSEVITESQPENQPEDDLELEL